ncbi:CRISPR-associated protein Cas4/endonuclease Cas1 fusion [Sporotomaculum syntrophicum]|uniref:CRISPR-associated endonuclease Cas1 n=1 Tax=Sporotomaculum syntrophicum TaxID=182264 RepID=A0A9D3AXP1_9FIRM|nr:type I-MYXAN CRISPR-associated endonuclease Cas1 [Sporotomaculum syntrophicum]KAF1083924.1 CRISPR-associated protein Cas4/endonuclease Cas1 fusion [Sporotomaculum syntrophicum]
MSNTIGESPIRVMALHALEYCERLFYLEEVEEIRLADASVYAGRSLHQDLLQAEGDFAEWTTFELCSETLGLIGKVDSLRRRDGSLIPYEHKKGKPRREGKKAVAWPSDILQVSAYGMLIEEETGQQIRELRIRYHAENITIRTPLDDKAKQNVINAVTRARELRNSTTRPPITENDRLCIRCSLAPVCLPEEDRLANNPEWEPIRLFPANREAKTIHVVEQNARISRAGDTLKIKVGDDIHRVIPIHEVGALVLHGYPQVTTQALHLCARNGIPVHYISWGEYYVAGLSPGTGPVQRRLRQYQALSNPGICLRLGRKLTLAKIESQLRYLLRATRGKNRDIAGINEVAKIMRFSLKQISRAEGIDSLRGYEGMAGQAYFSVIPSLLKVDLPETLKFLGRNRRPPRDRFNALLSYGYALLYQAVMQAVLAVGLEPALGFFHTPRSSAYPLVMDLMELFRVPLWDMVLIGSVNRMQWNPDDDFDIAGGRVWLSATGRKKAITLFEKRLEETWKHPVVGYSLSYARLIELEVRLLEKEWTGQSGLFAKMRLR